MSGDQTNKVVLLRPNGPTSLAGTPVSGRFCAWRGASDRRYVMTVYPVDRNQADAGLPDFPGFVALATVRSATGRRIVDVSMVEHAGGRRAAIARGISMGADEWHIYLLAGDSAARNATNADLCARHGATTEALCA